MVHHGEHSANNAWSSWPNGTKATDKWSAAIEMIGKSIGGEGILEKCALGYGWIGTRHNKKKIPTTAKIENEPVTVDVVEDAAAAIAALLSPV